jgi:hypothetical protein
MWVYTLPNYSNIDVMDVSLEDLISRAFNEDSIHFFHSELVEHRDRDGILVFSFDHVIPLDGKWINIDGRYVCLGRGAAISIEGDSQDESLRASLVLINGDVKEISVFEGSYNSYGDRDDVIKYIKACIPPLFEQVFRKPLSVRVKKYVARLLYFISKTDLLDQKEVSRLFGIYKSACKS